MNEHDTSSLNVAVIGAGYVGLTTGVALAYLGHSVVCTDKDASKIALLRSGKTPIHEPGLPELLSMVQKRLTFTEDTGKAAGQAETILIAVGTPERGDGMADTRFVEDAAREVALALLPRRRYSVVIKSTVPVGSNRRVLHIMEDTLRQRGIAGEVELQVVSNPEFLREGHALHDTFYPDRIVAGATCAEGIDAVRRMYRPVLEQAFDPVDFMPRPDGYVLPPLVSTSPTSAELLKYAANAFLALKISFINEIAELCERVEGDVVEVARGIGLDSRIGTRFLQAGVGWGGSCFPKDTAALLAMGREHNCPLATVAAAREANARQRIRAVERTQAALKGVRGRVIGILGLAFKPGTDDLRDAPALDIVRLLVERGAHVRVHDPVAMENARQVLGNVDVEYLLDPYSLADGADALLLVTEWSEYSLLDLERLRSLMRGPVLLDGRNAIDPAAARRAGFVYVGMGR